MLKKLLPMAAALCFIAFSSGTALAHEPRDVGDYNLIVGFMNEPAFEGILNGVYLSVTKGEDAAAANMSMDMSMESADSSAGQHASKSMEDHGPIESEVPVSVSLATKIDEGGGVAVNITTEGWLWTPDNVDGEHVPGEGHAHIYVDGVKISRVYGPNYHLGGLQPGERQVRVTLNSNSHSELTYGGKAVEATESVMIPGTSSHAAKTESEEAEVVASGNMHGEKLITGVQGLENTLQVEVTHVPSGSTRLMSLYALRGEQGKYKADFIPTASGQYVFHFTGEIEGMPVDERFESGGGRFDDVQPATAVQFPESAASTRELESAVRGALESAQQAQDTALAVEAAASSVESSASTATTLALAGIVVGALGIVVGGIGITAALRRRN